MYRVLLVEDDRGIAEALCAQLGDWGFAVRAVENFRDVTGEFRAFDPQLVLLDLMLPGLDGTALCRRIREQSRVPIIMLTAREEEADKVMGLELGADDYLVKPFDFDELLARIRAATRKYSVQKTDGRRIRRSRRRRYSARMR